MLFPHNTLTLIPTCTCSDQWTLIEWNLNWRRHWLATSQYPSHVKDRKTKKYLNRLKPVICQFCWQLNSKLPGQSCSDKITSKTVSFSTPRTQSNLEELGDIHILMTLLERLLLVPGTKHLRKVLCLSGSCVTRVLRIRRLGTPIVVLYLVRVCKGVLVIHQIATLVSPVVVGVTVPAPADTVRSFVVGSVQLSDRSV